MRLAGRPNDDGTLRRSDRHHLRESLEVLIRARLDQYTRAGFDVANSKGIVEEELEQLLSSFWDLGGDRIPPAGEEGFLPVLISSSERDLKARFGSGTRRRTALMSQLAEVLDLLRKISTRRVMLGGSFVTTAADSADVDLAVLVAPDFWALKRSCSAPHNELFIVSTDVDSDLDVKLEQAESGWWEWFRIFSRPRSPFAMYIGVVEVLL